MADLLDRTATQVRLYGRETVHKRKKSEFVPGNADVAAALGLADPPPAPEVGYVVVNGRTYCATCRCRTRADGICRRPTCERGGAR